MPFRSVAKITVMSTSQKEKISAVNADREIFGRPLVAAKHRHIDLKEVLSYELGQLLIKCLPSFHALYTGCDSTSALSGIGKKKAWKVLIKKNQIQGDLNRLGESSSLQDPIKEIAETFICSI